ncbi:MAG TPA: hypothetical protein VGO88_06845 [Mycetocola sp.]|nr:hypothetical protein [Mycetocola sp.]
MTLFGNASARGTTDAAGTTDALTAAGATVVAQPTETPWRSLNARLEAPTRPPGVHR